MASRTRTMPLGRMSGKAQFNWEGPYDPNMTFLPVGNTTCVDYPGHGSDCEPFTVNRLSDSGGYLNRTYGGTSTDNWFNNYICQFLRTTSNGQHLAVSGVPSQASRCTNAVARTNPSRPYVDVPVNILDIRTRIGQIKEDFDDLLKRLPRRYRRYRRGYHAAEHGDAWLQWKFLIEPLVGDIVKLANAQDQISRRIQDINRLYDKKGFRKTVDHGDWTSVARDTSVAIQTTYDIINTVSMTYTTKKCKTHVRWAPDRVALQPSPDVVRAWAVRSVMGGTIDLSTLWEITPWSWLADWFGNVGEYLKATRNIVPCHLVGVYPMEHTRTELILEPVTRVLRGRPTIFSGAKRIRETKTRSIGAVSITAQLNFLNESQMGILAALVASRGSRHGR